jgi:hypothetical protein
MPSAYHQKYEEILTKLRIAIKFLEDHKYFTDIREKQNFPHAFEASINARALLYTLENFVPDYRKLLTVSNELLQKAFINGSFDGLTLGLFGGSEHPFMTELKKVFEITPPFERDINVLLRTISPDDEAAYIQQQIAAKAARAGARSQPPGPSAAEVEKKRVEDAEKKRLEDVEIEKKRLEEAEIKRLEEIEKKRLQDQLSALSKTVEETKQKAEEEAARKAEAKAVRKRAEEEARKQAEEEAKKKAEEEARRKAEEEAARKAEAEAEARRKAEEEAARKAEAKAIRKRAEEEARKQAEEEAKKKAEEEARRKAEEEAARKAEAEAEAARKKAAEDARRQAEEEAKKKAEEEAKRKADEEAARKTEAKARKAAELQALIRQSTSGLEERIKKESEEKIRELTDKVDDQAGQVERLRRDQEAEIKRIKDEQQRIAEEARKEGSDETLKRIRALLLQHFPEIPETRFNAALQIEDKSGNSHAPKPAAVSANSAETEVVDLSKQRLVKAKRVELENLLGAPHAKLVDGIIKYYDSDTAIPIGRIIAEMTIFACLVYRQTKNIQLILAHVQSIAISAGKMLPYHFNQICNKDIGQQYITDLPSLLNAFPQNAKGDEAKWNEGQVCSACYYQYEPIDDAQQPLGRLYLPSDKIASDFFHRQSLFLKGKKNEGPNIGLTWQKYAEKLAKLQTNALLYNSGAMNGAAHNPASEAPATPKPKLPGSPPAPVPKEPETPVKP